MANNITNHDRHGALLTISETSQLLRIHRNTLRRWSDRGIIRAYRIGPRGDRRFRSEDVEALFKKRDSRADAKLDRLRRHL
jgi:excisionase family DNA binding protein